MQPLRGIQCAGIRRVEFRRTLRTGGAYPFSDGSPHTLVVCPPPRGFIFKPVWLKPFVSGQFQEGFPEKGKVCF